MPALVLYSAILVRLRNLLGAAPAGFLCAYLALSQMILVFNPDQYRLEVFEPLRFEAESIVYHFRLFMLFGWLGGFSGSRSR